MKKKHSVAELGPAEKKEFSRAKAAFQRKNNDLSTDYARRIIRKLLDRAAADKAIARLSKTLSVFGDTPSRKHMRAMANVRESAARSIQTPEYKVDNKGKK